MAKIYAERTSNALLAKVFPERFLQNLRDCGPDDAGHRWGEASPPSRRFFLIEASPPSRRFLIIAVLSGGLRFPGLPDMYIQVVAKPLCSRT